MVVAVDFDGTLCSNNYPQIGEPNVEVIDYIRMLKKQGHRIILWTCRCGKMLDIAIEWCKDKGLVFDAVNENITEHVEMYNSDSRKVFADIYLDDKSMKLSDVEEIQMSLLKKHYLKDECERKRYIAKVADAECITNCDMVCPWGKESPCKNCGLTDCELCKEKDIFIERSR